ncbi:MAG TPA: DUF3160 domain-containing protein, partial [Polyangiaceae bacterium]|nr:DUF3160 domain-containing protein [Polyangiaceae bacterium]
QTQLGSWAELRHDNILYGKQSYTGSVLCEYPTGYVEPYPEFYQRLGEVMRGLSLRLAALPYSKEEGEVSLRKHWGDLLQRFDETLARLQTMARKELAAEPFSSDEKRFLKNTIEVEMVGCGSPTFHGWYASLLYGSSPLAFKPVIADVHTDPDSNQVLEVGTGRANYLAVAIDNESHRGVYVGPVYSYYEFTTESSHRMTDEEWTSQLMYSKPPAAPTWVRSFQPAATEREFDMEQKTPANPGRPRGRRPVDRGDPLGPSPTSE